MVKWFIYILSLSPFLCFSEEQNKKDELTAIEQEIQTLKTQLHQGNLEELKEEVKGQGLMIADWDAYSKEMEQIRQQEEKERQIEEQIKKLEAKKEQLNK